MTCYFFLTSSVIARAIDVISKPTEIAVLQDGQESVTHLRLSFFSVMNPGIGVIFKLSIGAWQYGQLALILSPSCWLIEAERILRSGSYVIPGLCLMGETPQNPPEALRLQPLSLFSPLKILFHLLPVSGKVSASYVIRGLCAMGGTLQNLLEALRLQAYSLISPLKILFHLFRLPAPLKKPVSNADQKHNCTAPRVVAVPAVAGISGGELVRRTAPALPSNEIQDTFSLIGGAA